MPVTGQQLTGSVGEVDAISVAEVSGIELTGSVGSVTVDAGAEVNVSGMSASISVGSSGSNSLARNKSWRKQCMDRG